MLTVLVIMGIIMGIGIPAVTNLMKSGGLSAATRQVHNALSFARQYAITQRTYARVVFPYTATVSQPNMWYQTYAVMTNRVNTVPTGWVYVSKWESLPVGVVFLNLTNAAPGGGLDDLNSLNQQGGLPFSPPGNYKTLAYIEFTPTGAATAVGVGSGASTLVIAEGFMTGGVPNRPNTNNYATLTVDNVVGHIKVTRP